MLDHIAGPGPVNGRYDSRFVLQTRHISDADRIARPKLKAEEIGWFAWSWWPDSCLSRNIAIYNDVTNQFEGFRIPYGDDIVNNPDYGLKATAKPSSIYP